MYKLKNNAYIVQNSYLFKVLGGKVDSFLGDVR